MEPKISYDLYQTVEDHPHILEVHFSKDNNHYFNVQKFDGKLYGRLNTQQVHTQNVGDRKIYKTQNVANPKTEIVATLRRDEVLACVPVEETVVFPSLRDRRKQMVENAKAKNKAKAAETAETAE